MRRFQTLALSVALLGLSIVPALAGAFDSPIGYTLSSVLNQQAFGLGRLHQNYREYNNRSFPGIGDILDREDGSLTQLGYRAAVVEKRVMGNTAVDYATGDTFYDGHSLSGAQATDTTHNDILSLRGDIGYVVWANDRALVAPQLEFGYRRWTRHINGSGQEEKYSHMMLGVGLRGYYALTPELVISGLAFAGKTLDPTITGTAVFHWSAVSLGTAPYKRVGLAADYRLSGGWHVGLDADYVTWRYKQSAPFDATLDNGSAAGTFVEPESRTAQTSYLLTIGHEF